MKRSIHFLIVLVLGLAALTWGGSRVVDTTARRWFERDLLVRAQLAVSSARRSLVAGFRQNDRRALGILLADITRDDRIMGGAACTTGGALVAATSDFPEEFSCQAIRGRLSDASSGLSWSSTEAIRGGRVHVSAQSVRDEGASLGFVILVHDMSLFERREEDMHAFLMLAFAILSAAAAIITTVAARLSWRRWTNELRRLLRGEINLPEFRPFVSDVRDLVERVSAEHDLSSEGGRWGPGRLRQILSRHLHGERVVILANREPYIHMRNAGGAIEVQHPASGLVTALEPIMRACSGVWVAHGSGTADRETVDRRAHVRVPPGEESYSIRRVWLSEEQDKGYYNGFSNEGLWPLCHIADTRPIFRASDWKQYQEVNEKFARAVCEEVDSDDPIILVQDYHFALAPKLIRERLPRATILAFWHIPWPNSERFSVCPWRNEILEGLLGSSILGFHIPLHCNNFLDAVDRFLEARIDREQNAVVHHGRQTLVRPYPISIEWPSRWLNPDISAAEERKRIFAELKLRPNALLGVGVDRLDYTKGIEERLLAVERLLERCPDLRGRFTFVQLAAPSRTTIERYRLLNDSVEALVQRINARFGSGDYRPVILRRAHHEPPDVFRFYRAADVCYVSSLHDGMNLVAKEFVAARDDEQGVLVLSHFTGAARELTEALVVNPYDLEEASGALAAALRMSDEEQRDRMRSMRSFVAEFNVYRWAGRMLMDAARLRRKERLSGRIFNDFLRAAGAKA